MRAGSRSQRRRRALQLLALLFLAYPVSAAAQVPSSEEIQRNREEMESRKLQFLEEKARVEDFNVKVERYKELRENVPFSSVPGTTDLVKVYVNGHNVRGVAQDLYFLTNGASARGFRREYWPLFLRLNQAEKYDGGMPLYGPLDPERPEENVAVFPNVRKRGLEAIVADVDSTEHLAAIALTQPVVRAYERRLREEVAELVIAVGEPPAASGPARMSGERRVALFQHRQEEPRSEYPARRITDETRLAAASNVERAPVPVALAVALDPAPPAWSLRQEVNMLGSEYEGYNVAYKPGNFQLLPEGGAMAFFGGRDPQGNAHTQPGIYFSFNQKIYHLLLLNQTAFAAFSSGDAPAVNGGTLNAGIDIGIGAFDLAGMIGYSAYNVVGETATGVSFTAELRYLVTSRVFIGGIFTRSNAEVFQVEDAEAKRTGITKPGFVGLSVTIR
ncbi:MAG: hypothetical protein JSW67_04025 [Candidatus Latescibacterota bacterium]|nr:MAG: hypothetical protein JSW67_04025 [Candidatus Latescibacterota bacterium]